MEQDKKVGSTIESLRSTRTYGKFRCHNPTCMERLEPKKGQKTIKCPTCGMEFRIAWVKDGFPRIRGPVWSVNKKVAEEAFERKITATKSIEKEAIEKEAIEKDKGGK